jgi:hypothetical protein
LLDVVWLILVCDKANSFIFIYISINK